MSHVYFEIPAGHELETKIVESHRVRHDFMEKVRAYLEERGLKDANIRPVEGESGFGIQSQWGKQPPKGWCKGRDFWRIAKTKDGNSEKPVVDACGTYGTLKSSDIDDYLGTDVIFSGGYVLRSQPHCILNKGLAVPPVYIAVPEGNGIDVSNRFPEFKEVSPLTINRRVQELKVEASI